MIAGVVHPPFGRFADQHRAQTRADSEKTMQTKLPVLRIREAGIVVVVGVPEGQVLEARGRSNGLLPLVERRVDADRHARGLGRRDALLDELEVAVDVVPASGALLDVEPQHPELDVVGLEVVDEILDCRRGGRVPSAVGTQEGVLRGDGFSFVSGSLDRA